MNELITKVFIKQPLASPGSAKYFVVVSILESLILKKGSTKPKGEWFPLYEDTDFGRAATHQLYSFAIEAWFAPMAGTGGNWNWRPGCQNACRL